jgi:hypothetical protein
VTGRGEFDREDAEETVGLSWLCQREAMVDGWPMSSRYMMMAMKLLVPRDTVAGAEEVIVARPRKVAGESVLDCCYNK